MSYLYYIHFLGGVGLLISLIASLMVFYIYNTNRHSEIIEFRLIIHIIYVNTFWVVVELINLPYSYYYGHHSQNISLSHLIFIFVANFALQVSALFAIILSFCAYKQIFSELFTIQSFYNKFIIIGYTIPLVNSLIITELYYLEIQYFLYALQLLPFFVGFLLIVYYYVRMQWILTQTKIQENFKEQTRTIFMFPLLMVCFFFLPLVASLIYKPQDQNILTNILIALCEIYFPLYGLCDSLLYLRFSKILTKRNNTESLTSYYGDNINNLELLKSDCLNINMEV